MRNLLPSLFCLLVFSCKKDDSKSDIPKVRQMAVSFLNPTNPSHIDFSFDGEDRVIKMFFYMGDSGVAVATGDSLFLMQFYYSGSGELPYKIDLTQIQQRNTDVHFLSYDINSRLIKDSIQYVNAPFYYLNIFEHLAGNIVRTGYYKNSQLPPQFDYRDTMHFQNGNFVRLTRAGASFMRTGMTYDNGINPLHGLNIAPVSHVLNPSGDPSITIWSIWSPMVSRNNMVKHTYYYNGIVNNQAILQYHYNSENLPVYRLWKDQGGNVVDSLTYKY